MSRVVILYGSTTGNTYDVSEKLQKEWGESGCDLVNVADADADLFARYDFFIFGVSTWGAGDLQDDWEEFFPSLDDLDLTGKTVAIMGLGDQENYPDHFCDCVGILHDKVIDRGGRVIGYTKAEGYTYTASRGEREGKLLGLLLDEDSQSALTDGRIRKWVGRLKKSLG